MKPYKVSRIGGGNIDGTSEYYVIDRESDDVVGYVGSSWNRDRGGKRWWSRTFDRQVITSLGSPTRGDAVTALFDHLATEEA